MHDAEFLGQIAMLFGTAVVVSWIFRLAKAPSIIGFLCTGMVIGPASWGLIEESAVAQFAEVGLVLLLFTIGLELSPAPLLRMGVRVLRAMGVIAVFVIAITMLVMVTMGDMPWVAAMVVGIAVSLSSTAIVLKQLSDRGEVQSTMGNLITGILLLQDVFVIMVMMLLPALVMGGEGHGDSKGPALMVAMFAGLAIVALVARRVLPTVITQLLLHGGREMMTLFAVMMACGGAYAAQIAGWPPALGACIAGLLLANADIRHQLVAEITPFRDVFNALFFIALGMTVQVDVVLVHWDIMILAVGSTLLLKCIITVGAVKLAGWPYRVAFQVGVGLCSVSEFGYVLVKEADSAGLLPANFIDGMVGYTVGTMILGSIIFPLGTRLTGRVSVILNQIDGTRLAEKKPTEDFEEELEGHVIIVGFGINGENLVRVLKATQIPHCVIEMNQGLIHKAREMEAPVVLGDATRAVILEHAGIGKARAIVIAVNTQEDTRRIVSQSRRLNPDIYIAVRTYFVRDLRDLAKQGVDMVVPADFEASVKIFSHVLEEFDVPRNILASQIAAVRAGDYGVFRGESSSSNESLQDLLKVLQLTSTQTFYLAESSAACGKTIADLELRKVTGATVIAVVRDREPNTNPGPEYELQASDVLVLVGAHEQLRAAGKVLDASTHLGSSRADPEEKDG